MSINRRGLLVFGAALAFSGRVSAMRIETMASGPSEWLAPTPFVDLDHPSIKAKAQQLTNGLSNPIEKALAIFHFVRDEVKFGFARGFWHNKASEVLSGGVGYCNTKSTLFIALLRASGIPARQVFVDIRASVLHGIIDPGTPYVDHSYVELFLNDAWIKTDAYIVDAAMFKPAQQMALEQERLMGFGVHQTGTSEFDGINPAFSQFNLLDPRPISTRHWGVFKDIGDFYDQSADAWNKTNGAIRFGFGLLARAANRRAEDIRKLS